MEPLIIKSTNATPTINFNPKDGRFELSGCCRPEDANSFYSPLIKYIDDYQKKIEGGQIDDGIKSNEFVFILKFIFINSVSTKFLCEFLMQVLKFKDMGISFTIDWFYEKNDEDMCELGEDISDIVDHPFNYYSFIREE